MNKTTNAAAAILLMILTATPSEAKSKDGAAPRSLGIETMGLAGRGVTVAVVDTGVDSSHRDLVGVVIDEACFCMSAQGEPCCPNGTSRELGAGSARDDNGHGTHISGIIAGQGRVAPKGLATETHIVAIKIADREGSTSTWSMLAALDWLATSGPEVQVVNMSLGTAASYEGNCDAASPNTRALAAAGRTLRGRGALLLAAAGNSGLPNRISAPACITGFLSVGAVRGQKGLVGSPNGCTDDDVKSEDRVSCFSNSSSALAILAPGAGILSVGIGGGTATGSGTSQATAMVSGAAALLFEGAHGRATADQVEAALCAHGVPVIDPRNQRVTPRVDARSALNALSGL